jgi:hypothetical protein
MRKAILASVAAVALSLGAAASAAAHVHGVTPLIDCGVANSNAGAVATDDTPAAQANGGPIGGLIPATVGESSLGFGDGGFAATAGHCP